VAKSIVACVRCESYNRETVLKAVDRGIDLLGGIDQFVSPGEKILLKPNVLAGDPPEKAVTTHPSILYAAGKLFLKKTDKVSYGDSPGSGDPAVQLKAAALTEPAEELGLELADFRKGIEKTFRDSPFTKRFLIAEGALEADGIISLCKMKTHSYTRVTGAVKNQFGCIPGNPKKGFHLKLPSGHDFSKMLVALTLFLKPRLYIMDGITAMEGNGPRGGNPKEMNIILLSRDPVAMDAVMCRCIDLNPEYVPTMKPGKDWGLGTYLEDEITLIGDPIEDFVNTSFNVNRKPYKEAFPTGMMAFAKNLVIPRPVIDFSKCVMCGICVQSCPVTPKALNWKKGRTSEPPVYKYIRCIRCYCCQEICPEGAISVKKSAFSPLGE